jgi:acetyltransferase-like isoleucine patch superfamily enzyme
MHSFIKNKVISLVSWTQKIKYATNVKYQIDPSLIANKLIIKGPGTVIIEPNCNFWSHAEPCQLITYTPQAVIHIQSGTRINGATIQARSKIKIGKKCRIGSTLILDNDFHNPHPNKRNSKEDIPTKPINIGNNVWLCGQSVVLKGTKIGDNSVLAMRAVASKDIPLNSLAVGNPAKTVKTY